MSTRIYQRAKIIKVKNNGSNILNLYTYELQRGLIKSYCRNIWVMPINDKIDLQKIASSGNEYTASTASTASAASAVLTIHPY